ncbi:MAG: Rpn family recombination-promoting nuclease/putative transposase [Treponema sp.]|nr:Rpn family recombination-promoting nuclease/putative transposase [Treponema sp.]
MEKIVYHRKSFDELTFTDDGMFQAVLSDPNIASELVERLLHFRVKKIEYPELEKVIAPYYSSKGVRLDVYLKDSEKVIDVELQTYPQEALGLRTRYYQSMMDSDCLLKGQDYPDLPASYILFICKTDPFADEEEEKYGLPCYTFETICRENGRVKIDDKTLKVIYNASAYDKAEDERIRAFLHFIHTNSTGEDDFSQRLSKAVERLKENEKFRRDYAAMNLHDRDIQRITRREALAEGMAKGLSKGIAQGQQQKAVEDAGNLLRMKLGTVEQIAQATSLPLEQVQEIANRICVQA